MKKFILLLTVLVSFVVTTPAQADSGGAVLGGLLGAVAGSQIGGGNGRLAAIGVGATLGAMTGDKMSSPPQQPARRAVYQVPQYGQQGAGGDPEIEAARAQGLAERNRAAKAAAIQAAYQCGRDGSC